ncbi:unknown [Clostridium sp. CAG:448]|nr:unknown [Clostridium sp. CAG:448]
MIYLNRTNKKEPYVWNFCIFWNPSATRSAIFLQAQLLTWGTARFMWSSAYCFSGALISMTLTISSAPGSSAPLSTRRSNWRAESHVRGSETPILPLWNPHAPGRRGIPSLAGTPRMRSRPSGALQSSEKKSGSVVPALPRLAWFRFPGCT